MISFEEQYYENDALWDPSRVTSADLARVDRVLSKVPRDAQSLLDIGCGNGICCNRAAGQHAHLKRIVGVDRSREALKYVRTEKHCGQIDGLPFDDGEFDVSVCLEVLEHLPVSCYQRAIAEIPRVTRKQIIITVPNKERLHRNTALCPQCKTRFHRSLHMRSFCPANLADLFAKSGFVCRELCTIPVSRYLGLGLVLSAYGRLRGEHLPLTHCVCPVCGHFDHQRPIRSAPFGRLTPLKGLAKRIWPRALHHRWLMAVYGSV